MPHRISSRIASASDRFPRLLLLLSLLVTVGLGLIAAGVPDRLALGGGIANGSESAEAEQSLSDALGYEAQPTYLLVLTGPAPISSPATQVALDALVLQTQAIEGVEAVTGAGRSPDGHTATLQVHLGRGLAPDEISRIGEELGSGLDPGALELLLGGATATAEAARASALDDAPKLELLALPLVALILAGSLGVRFGAAALLAACLASAASVSALGLISGLAELGAITVAATAVLAALLAFETAAMLLFRYREESATLGAGSEALECSIDTVLRGAALGMVAAALVGLALLVVPIDSARAIGAGTIAAALLGPSLALLPAAAALSLRAESEVGSALPLVADDDRAGAAPRSFRWLSRLARERRRALVGLLPVAVAVALTIPILDSEAIGLNAAELPDGDQAREAEAVLSGAFGPGGSGPLQVVTGGGAEDRALTLYRDEIRRLDGIAAVGLAVPAGPLASFEATPDARPRSLGAETAATAVRGVSAPTDRRIGGPGAEVLDAGAALAGNLPLVGLLAVLGSAALWSLLFRAAFAPLLAIAALVAPLAGIGSMLLVFGDGRLSGALDYVPSGAPHLESFVVVVAVLGAIGLNRSASLATALAEERSLGGGVVGSITRSSLMTLMPAAVASLCGLALAGVWGASELLAAKEIAVGLSLGLIADLALTRMLLAPALARLSL